MYIQVIVYHIHVNMHTTHTHEKLRVRKVYSDFYVGGWVTLLLLLSRKVVNNQKKIRKIAKISKGKSNFSSEMVLSYVV